MRIDLLARRWGSAQGGRDGMAIAASYLAWTLADLGHEVRCSIPEGSPHPWEHALVEWVHCLPIMGPPDWTADLVITTISPAWRRTVIAAQRARARGRLIYWHHHGPVPPGHGCILARVAPGEPAQGWAREIVLPPGSWALYEGDGEEPTGSSIVVLGATRAKGGDVSLAVARQVTDRPWYVLPGRAGGRELPPWRALPHAVVAMPGLPPSIWLDRARVVLSPTRAETYGLAMAEAAVRGIPVVTSDLPGPRHALGDVASYLPAGAPVSEWVAALRAALEQEPRRLRLPIYADVVEAALLPLAGTSGPDAPRPRRRAVKSIRRAAPPVRAVVPPRPASPPPPGPLITVSMPIYRMPPEILRRAVESVLAQTERRIRVILVNDGGPPVEAWAPLADLDDPRIVRFDLPTNHGRYYADAVTLAACATMWWSPHDSDDWSEPDRLARLLALSAGADVVLGAQWVHGSREKTQTRERPREWTGPDPALRWYGHMAALWSPAWLRSVGGPHPGYRVGYDTVMTGLAHLCGRVATLEDPLYHRCWRMGSLTKAPETGMGSPHRQAAAVALRDLWAQAVEAGPAGAGRVILSSVAADDLAAVAVDAERLRAALREAPAVAYSRGWGTVLDRDLWQDWALHRATAAEIQGRLAQLRPGVVIEAGSGSSTLLLGAYARATGGRALALEHQPRYLEQTRELLAAHGLAGAVELVHAPLDARPWYQSELPDGIGYALVDGPPLAAGGRAAALPALLPHLAEGWELWLDDGARTSERATALGWAREHGVCVEHLRIGKGLLRVTASPVERPQVDASDVVLTILTGGRAAYLADTLASTERTCPGLLTSASVVVLRQGTDEATSEVLWRHMAHFDQVHEQAEVRPIGAALSQLAALAAASGRRYWLHLEDDWRAITTVDGWLDTARGALAEPKVGQVRLRHLGDDVGHRHMITGQPIEWVQHGAVLIADAHWTFNPALMRVADIGSVYPCDGELQAMRRVREAGLPLAAHACPGVWTHTGDESLRVKTRCKL